MAVIKTVQEESLVALGDAIREKAGTNEPLVFPAGMIEAIENITTRGAVEALDITANGTYTAPEGLDGYSPITVNVPQDGAPPEEAFTITGQCGYRFAEGGWDWFLNKYGNQITTKDITDCQHMFHNSNVEAIPFDINLSNSVYSFSYMFYGAENLKQLPLIKGTLVAPTGNYSKNPNMDNLFQMCQAVREIPYDYFDNFGGDEFWAVANTYSASRAGMFSYCYSLRRLPNIKKLLNAADGYGNLYYGLIQSCATLDEITDIPIPTTVKNSNNFNYSFQSASRLKTLTFETNKDGSPKIVSWKSQIIDLTKNIGFASGDFMILNYNSGITADKLVKDDATYQALKDDPDWFTTNVAYSRYNHDSAVETINSLPDTSAYLATAGGTNTIKFKGAAGSATDGGACNTLTEEEIAVATAKGWTVSFT